MFTLSMSDCTRSMKWHLTRVARQAKRFAWSRIFLFCKSHAIFHVCQNFQKNQSNIFEKNHYDRNTLTTYLLYYV
jgi:hypothetical protein